MRKWKLSGPVTLRPGNKLMTLSIQKLFSTWSHFRVVPLYIVMAVFLRILPGSLHNFCLQIIV